MDFLNPDDAAREATLDYRDLQALTQFHNYQTRKQFAQQDESEREETTILGKPKDLCQQFAARYPTIAFQTLDRNELAARIKDSVSGALIEQLGFIHHGIPHLTATIGVNWDSIQIAFRADGIGIIKEESWYEFFDHELDLVQVRQECADDEQAIHEALDEYFREHVGPNLEDPFFDPASEDCSLYFQCGSEEELKRLLTLCLLTEPDIAAHADENLQICAATDCDRPYLGDYHSYHTRRLEELLAVVLQENEPVGWSFEYNDGVANRQSGYSENAECLCWNIGELLEAFSARERMAARRELREYLAARQLDLARFDALAVKTEKGSSPYESLAASVYAHGGGDLRDAIESMPGLGGIALWVKFCDADTPTLIAQTDGIRITAGPRYHEYAIAERRFIVLHELLHIALAHPARAREMEKRVADFDARLYNTACDAIINASLTGVHGIRQPADAVTLERVLSQLGLWQRTDDVAVVVWQWSSEALYHALAKQRDQLDLGKLTTADGFGSNDLVPDAGVTATNTQPADGDHSTEDTIRAWHARLQMARGSLAGIFIRLTNELPQVKTPWERILRDLLFRHAQRKRRLDPARPSRRWLALENELRQNEGVSLPFERATRPAHSGRIALAVDTSGSVDETLLKRFATEVAAVLEQTDPQLRLIVCDAEVHQVRDFTGREAARHLRDFSFKGGGGTDFRPAIAEAAQWKPDLLIYLTDLEGEAGSAPSFPVLWAVPEGKAIAPWGKIVELN